VLPDTRPQSAPAPARANAKPIAVAVSFPGEHRDFVEHVVYALRNSGVKRDEVFYDRFREAEMSRPNLDLYLLDIYAKQSELVVVFLGGDYARKEWCRGLEWRAVRELIKTMNEHMVMPVRLDEAEVPGLLSIDGYTSAANRDPEQIASLIMQRLKANRKREEA
jgi:hypothetical protein